MRIKSSWNRRGFLGTAAAIAASVFAPRKLFSTATASSAGNVSVTGFGQSGNPYDELGVTTVINCEGTMTMLGGSVLRPELEAVMAMAGRHFVNIPALEVAAGKRIAEMLKLPDGYTALVTSGAAAAIQSGLNGRSGARGDKRRVAVGQLQHFRDPLSRSDFQCRDVHKVPPRHRHDRLKFGTKNRSAKHRHRAFAVNHGGDAQFVVGITALPETAHAYVPGCRRRRG